MGRRYRAVRGDGSIYKAPYTRKDGSVGTRWIAQIVYTDATGRRIRKAVSGSTQTEARAKRDALKRTLDAGFSVKDETRLDAVLESWLESNRKIQESTRDFYKGVMRNYITPFLGLYKVRELRPMHVNALLTRLAREKSERIAWSAHVVLRAALNFAVREGVLPVNPCNSVERPKRQQKKPQPLTREQTVLFLREADSEALRALFILAVETGLRSGEILGLKSIDFDETTRMLAVRRQARVRKSDRNVGRKTSIELVERTKTGRARSLLLSHTTAAAVRQHIEHVVAEGTPNPHGLLFPGAGGAPMQRGTLNRIFRRILRRAKLPLIRFHDLRHTAATLLLLQGVHPKIAQERLGHTNIAMTLDLYSAWMPSLQAEAVDAISSVLRDAERDFEQRTATLEAGKR